jgi:hypothetical protein
MRILDFSYPPLELERISILETEKRLVNKTTANINKTNNTANNNVSNNVNNQSSIQLTDELIDEIVKRLREKYDLENLKKVPKIIIENRNPTPRENLGISTVWVNRSTGEVFLCVDDTKDRNKWAGSFGTVIEPDPFYVVDFFNDNSIVAFYRFNGSCADETGLYHGMNTGATKFVKGLYDKALDFGEVPNSINAFMVQDISLFPEMNYSFWVLKYTDNQINPYISLAYADIYNAILLFEHMGIFKIIIDNKLYAFRKAKVIPTKQWHFISLNIKRNPQVVELYINGKFVDNVYYITDFRPEKYSGNNCLIFGQDQDTYCSGFESSQSFLGRLDQFRIFSRALKPEEIQKLYNEEP